MRSARSLTPLSVAILLTASMLAFLLVIRASGNGLGFSPDSVSYFTMAEGIAAGKGFVDVRRYDSPALPIYPPGYSLLIAAAGLAGGDLMAALPILQGLLFAAAVALLVWGLLLASNRVLAGCGAFFFLGSGDTVTLYSKVWSESAFLVATLLFMVLLARHLESPQPQTRDLKWLIGAALAAGFAAIVRYPGVAAIGGGGLVLLLGSGSGARFKRRLQDAALFGIVASLPLALWLMRNILVFGRPYLSKDRAASAAAFSSRNLELGLETLTRWTGVPTGAYVICLGLVAVGLALCNSDIGGSDPHGSGKDSSGTGSFDPSPHGQPTAVRPAVLLIAAAAFALPYAAVMLAGTYGYGLHKPLDYRALSPIFGPLLWLLLLGAQGLGRSLPMSSVPLAGFHRRAGAMLLGLALVATAMLAGRSAWAASDPAKAYGILQKKPRPVVEAFKDIEPTGKVFTNIDAHLYLLTGKPCLRLPQVYSLDGRDQPLPNFEEKMAELESQLGEHGMIVYYSPSRRLYLPSEDELNARLPLEIVRATDDGTIYRIRRPDSR